MRSRLLVLALAALFAPALAGATAPVPERGGAPGDGSSAGSPGHGSPGYGEPGYGDPGYGDPGYGDPGYGDPGYGDPGYGDPGYGDPGYGDPGYGEPPPAGGPVDRMLSDAQIFGVLHVVNQGTVLIGQQALRKASDPAVREFAHRLVAEHATADERLTTLAGRLGLLPEPSGLSAKLEGMTAHVFAKLERFQGTGYDVAYVDLQLAGRGGLVALLDFLSLQATSPELKAAIDHGRPLILSQLAQATAIREWLPNP